MADRTDQRAIAVAGIFLVGTAGALALVAAGPLPRGIAQIATVIAGTLFAVAISAVFRLITAARPTPAVRLAFEVDAVREALRVARATQPPGEMPPAPPPQPWEPTADQLLLDDPTLALAKMRLDVERELRRLAVGHNVARADQRLDVARLAALLEDAKVIPPEVGGAIRDVLPIFEAALRGRAIGTREARQVVDVASDIIAVLSART